MLSWAGVRSIGALVGGASVEGFSEGPGIESNCENLAEPRTTLAL